MLHALRLAAVAVLAAAPPVAAHDGPGPHHHQPPQHPRAAPDGRFFTSRAAAALPLPSETDAFFFAIFGDRTGGPPEGVEVLAQAVADVNLLEPDLVLTVGDLVEGYNQTDEWMVQMREYKGIMDRLCCPWFPVPGNHDVYFRGPNPPPGQHEVSYEAHFGPLWYAFEHKGCWFIVLYSDEGDPATGEKSFDKPACQVMSPAQFSWLQETLRRVAGAPHVFLFLHHPRWLGGGYGDDWERVHRLLVEAGNVSAVFAGHIHHMRYDGPRDGIEYVTLATTGGANSFSAPEAGYLHHFHIVTVRPDHIAIAGLPVGEVMDVRAITGQVSEDAAVLAGLRPRTTTLELGSDGSADGLVQFTLVNPVNRPIEITLRAESDDSRWRFSPDHQHRTIEPGASGEFAFRAARVNGAVDDTFRLPRFVQQVDYLAEGFRYVIPEVRLDVPMHPDLPPPSSAAPDHALTLDGRRDVLRVASDVLELPDGPLTLECWFNASAFGARTGLVNKTENSELGLFVSGGVPEFVIHVGGGYATARAATPILSTGTWHHLAGVFDGREARLYLDGRQVAAMQRAGARTTNRLPLLIGADVDAHGAAVSHFQGQIDALRLSSVARYAGASFAPARRVATDEHTLLLLDMDAASGPWMYDGSGRRAHPVIEGSPRVEPPR